MRSIMDEFKKKCGLDSIDKDLKSKIRKNVDIVFAQVYQEGNFLKTPISGLQNHWE